MKSLTYIAFVLGSVIFTRAKLLFLSVFREFFGGGNRLFFRQLQYKRHCSNQHITIKAYNTLSL